jgi:hypothetical protein
MKRRQKESGYALLMVLLLAACIAIMLYREVPRVAFEAERQREMMLVDRGNQFKRAIQVFVTDKTNNPTRRYPASLDELESFNNHRYLRRRYVDPMTGKDEWRLVHINGGVLTDSVTTQQPSSTSANGAQPGSTTPNPPAYITSQAYMDPTNPNGTNQGGVTRALNRRPSDSMQPGAAGSDPSQQSPDGSPGTSGSGGIVKSSGASSGNEYPPMGAPGQPGSGIPGLPGQPGLGIPGLPGTPGAPSGGAAAQPCTVYIGSCPSTGSGQTGQPSQPGGGMPGAFPGAAGSSGMGAGMGQPGTQMNSPGQGAAASMINGLLTTPRPGGMPSTMPGATIGGGIAGVASKYQAEGIMVINTRTAINEWEYIFDATKYRAPPNPVSGAIGTQLAPMNPSGALNGTPIGAPLGGQTAPGTNPPTGPTSPSGTGQ